MDKIVFFEIEDWEREYINKSLSGYNLVFNEQKLTKENAANFADAKIISTFIYSFIDKELLEKLPSLKFIATRSMGFDHIDVEFCRQKGIVVSNVPTYGAHTVAEHTFALILAI
jgi:D-lactate dehydrogenase